MNRIKYAGALLAACLVAACSAEAPADDDAETAAGTVPAAPDPADYADYLPDATHIPFMSLDDVPWEGEEGREQQYYIYGNPREAGPYAMLLKWFPGNFSQPHFHPTTRYVTVLEGTWWVSSSNVYDPNKTYPLGPGTIVRDEVNTVHWDGAKDEPVTLLITGVGPSPNTRVDENGDPTGDTNF